MLCLADAPVVVVPQCFVAGCIIIQDNIQVSGETEIEKKSVFFPFFLQHSSLKLLWVILVFLSEFSDFSSSHRAAYSQPVIRLIVFGCFVGTQAKWEK
jgi:hypothetical protein